MRGEAKAVNEKIKEWREWAKKRNLHVLQFLSTSEPLEELMSCKLTLHLPHHKPLITFINEPKSSVQPEIQHQRRFLRPSLRRMALTSFPQAL